MRYRESLNKYLPFFQNQHALFKLLAEQSFLYFVDNIPTAAVTMSPEGQLAFIANEEFWEEEMRGFLDRVFVIAHEMMHLFLNHLPRIAEDIPEEYVDVFNIAADLFINHFVEDNLCLSRNFLCEFLKEKGCWVETVFGDEEKWGDIEQYRGKSVEFYYNLLKEEKDEYIQELKKQLDAMRTISKEDYNNLSDDQKRQIQKVVKDAIYDAGMEDAIKDNGAKNIDLEKVCREIQAGNGSGSFEIIRENKPIQQKKRWESVIKRWCKRTVMDSRNENKRWGFADRKFNQVQKHCQFHLPGDVRKAMDGNGKNSVAMFLDVSGSCYSYKETFMAAAKTVPTKYFDLRLFAFDTRVTEVKKGQGIYAGGGTSFSPIPKAIEQAYGKKHPDVVFLLTDGYGTRFHTNYPERYVWFLTEWNTIDLIPPKSKIFYLADFIVDL